MNWDDTFFKSDLFLLCNNISTYSMLLPFIVGFLMFKKSHITMRYFFGIISLFLLIEIVMNILAYLHQYNLWLSNIVYLLQLLLLFCFFYINTLNRIYKKMLVFFGILFTVIWSTLIFHFGLNNLEPYSLTIGSVFTLLACGYNMIELVTNDEPNLFRSSYFIISLMYFLYSAVVGVTSIFLTNTIEFILNNPLLWNIRMMIHNAVNLFLNVGLAYSFLCKVSKPKPL